MTLAEAKQKINELLDKELELICHDIADPTYGTFHENVMNSIRLGRREGYFEGRMVFTRSNYVCDGIAYKILEICKPFIGEKERRKYDDDESLLVVLKKFVTDYDLETNVGCSHLLFKFFKGKRRTKTGEKLYLKIRHVLDRFHHNELQITMRPFLVEGIDLAFSSYGSYSS